MPVKWTPDNDQMLLLKILETHNDLTVDSKKVSAAWPAGRDQPTPRAISERLVKIRQLANANGAGHFNITSGRSSTKTNTKPDPSTPRKPRLAANSDATTSAPTASGATKRKRAPLPKSKNGTTVTSLEDDDDDEDIFDMKVSSQEAAWLNGHGNGNGDGNADAYPTPDGAAEKDGGVLLVCGAEAESPSKKARREVKVKVETYGYDGMDDGESSVSEFADAV